MTYTFSHVETSYNAMSLRSQTAVIPLYHVAVRLNCFIPSSYITIISRGDEYGEEVGSFECVLCRRAMWFCLTPIFQDGIVNQEGHCGAQWMREAHRHCANERRKPTLSAFLLRLFLYTLN